MENNIFYFLCLQHPAEIDAWFEFLHVSYMFYEVGGSFHIGRSQNLAGSVFKACVYGILSWRMFPCSRIINKTEIRSMQLFCGRNILKDTFHIWEIHVNLFILLCLWSKITAMSCSKTTVKLNLLGKTLPALLHMTVCWQKSWNPGNRWILPSTQFYLDSEFQPIGEAFGGTEKIWTGWVALPCFLQF